MYLISNWGNQADTRYNHNPRSNPPISPLPTPTPPRSPRWQTRLLFPPTTTTHFSQPGNRKPLCFRRSLTDRFGMSTGEMLSIEPQELLFTLELRKQISCSLQLSNKTDSYIAFKVKTTNPKKYCVRPNTGVVLPRSTCDVIVTMQAQKEVPLDMQCKDKFLLQSVVAGPGATAKDITPEMFNKESGHLVEECRLRVVYVSPPCPPSPAQERTEEVSSPKASVSDNGNLTIPEYERVSRAYNERLEPKDNTSESRALILKLTEEKNSAIQKNSQLQQELELWRSKPNQSHGGISYIVVIFVGLLGIILGYLVKKT